MEKKEEMKNQKENVRRGAADCGRKNAVAGSRVREAVERKSSGRCNCAQAVACCYADVAGLDEDVVCALTAAFGSGMGTMTGTCGALVGAGVVIGAAIGDRVLAREAMKRMVKAFEDKNGATICRELKGVDTGKPLCSCNDCVADAASILEAELGKL